MNQKIKIVLTSFLICFSLLLVSFSAMAAIQLGTETITFTQPISIGTPTLSAHATTKAYVDSMFSGSGPWTLSGTNVYVTKTTHSVGIGTTSPAAKVHIKDTLEYKIKYIGGQSGYTKTVILLHEIYNGTNLNNNYAVGMIFASRGSTGAYNRKEIAYIDTGSAYQTTNGTVTSLSSGNLKWNLVTCMYNGIKYMAVEIPHSNAQVDGIMFIGNIYSTAPNSLVAIGYYNNQTSTILNSEINSSITPFTNYDSQYIDVSKFYVSGNFGIGQTSPGYKLDVSGTGRFTGALKGTTAAFSGTVSVATPTASNHAVTKTYVDSAISSASSKWTTSGTNTYLTATGNKVGIGTTSPIKKVQVNDGLFIGNSFTVTTGSIFTSSNQAQLILGGTHNAGYNIGSNIAKLLITGQDNDGAIIYPIYVEDENGLVDFWLKNRASASVGPTAYFAGNVGIGTSAPGYKLDVSGTGRFTGKLTGVAAAFSGTVSVATPTASNHATTKSYVDGLVTGASSKWTVSGTNTYLTATGNKVGIGTTSPAYKLTVNGTIGTPDMNNPYLVLDSSGSGGNAAEQSAQISLGEGGRGSASLHLAYTGDGYSYIGMGTLSGNIPTYYAMRMKYTNNNIYFPGSIGIGQTAPGYKLDVSGTGRFTGAVIVGTPTASNHATTKAYVDAAAGVSVTLRDVASGTTGNAVCTANSSVCLDVVVPAAPYPSLAYSCLWTNTGSTLKARCLK